MAITKAPKRTASSNVLDDQERERRAQAWIAEGGSSPAEAAPPRRPKEPVNMKVDADFLARIDADVKRRGTNRTHWILDACAEKLARSE